MKLKDLQPHAQKVALEYSKKHYAKEINESPDYWTDEFLMWLDLDSCFLFIHAPEGQDAWWYINEHNDYTKFNQYHKVNQ